MKTATGYLQGYNAQVVTNEHQIVVAADVLTQATDGEALSPMVAKAIRELAKAGIAPHPRVLVADAGYWSNDQLDRVREGEVIPIVAVDGRSRAGPRPDRRGGPYEFMRMVLRSPLGAALYAKRQWMTEPVFADIKVNRRAGRFKRRGLAAVRSDWSLLTATHNLLKLYRHQLTVAAA
jgi:hypothetical protein